MRAMVCMAAFAPPQAPVSFLAAQARKLSRSASLGWAQPLLGGLRKPKNATQGTTTAMQLSSKY